MHKFVCRGIAPCGTEIVRRSDRRRWTHAVCGLRDETSMAYLQPHQIDELRTKGLFDRYAVMSLHSNPELAETSASDLRKYPHLKDIQIVELTLDENPTE